MYWITLISSITGILSFVFYFVDTFKKWRKYLLHYLFFTIGLTAGLIISMTSKAVQSFDQSQVIYLIAFCSIMSFLGLFVYKYLNHTNDSFIISILVIVGISYFSVRLLNSVEQSQSFIKPSDYIILSQEYYETGNYSKSAKYLKKYRDIETINLSEKMIDSLDKKIEKLLYKSFDNID